MERIIAINSNTYHGFTLEQAINGISKAGFKYIELTATKGWTEHVFPDMSFEKLIQIKEDLLAHGLKPYAMSGHCNLMDQERIEDFIMNIRLAAFFECDFIISSVGEAHLKDKKEVTDEEVAEEIKNLIPYLEEYNLILCLENHGKHATGKQLKKIIDRIGSPRVMINYDTANAIYYGNVNLEEDLDSCIDKIAHMHLKDKDGEYNEWNFPAIGKGNLDFEMVLEKLEAAGNHCPLSIEIEFTKAGPENLEEVDQAVQDSYDYLIKAGKKI